MPRYHATLANLYAHDGQLEPAVEHASKARALGLASVANDQLLGQILCRLERFDEASEVLEQSNRAAPRNFATLAYLSVAREALGSGMGALEAVGQAIELRPFSVRGPDAGTTPSLTVVVVESCDPSFFKRANILNYNAHNYPSLPHRAGPSHGAHAADAGRGELPGPSRRPPGHVVVNNVGGARDGRSTNSVNSTTPSCRIIRRPGHAGDQWPRCRRCLRARRRTASRYEAETGFIFPRLRRIYPRGGAGRQHHCRHRDGRLSGLCSIRHPQSQSCDRAFGCSKARMQLREALVDMSLPALFRYAQYHECRDDDGISRQYRVLRSSTASRSPNG